MNNDNEFDKWWSKEHWDEYDSDYAIGSRSWNAARDKILEILRIETGFPFGVDDEWIHIDAIEKIKNL